MNFGDGAPYELKGSRTVWVGGKGGDNIKVLPIDISRNAFPKRGAVADNPGQLVAGLAHRAAETRLTPEKGQGDGAIHRPVLFPSP